MIGLFILFFANSIFLGTNDGMERTFVGSFTGDAVISSENNSSVSLFGNELPIVSNLETIHPLYSHQQIKEKLENVLEIESMTSIVSVQSLMTIDNVNNPVALFGIDPETYFTVCTDIKRLNGDLSQLGESGVFLNAVLADQMETKIQRPLIIGEEIKFTVSTGSSFRIRTAPFLGIQEYSGATEALDLVVLADLTIVRSLADYTLGFTFGKDSPDLSGKSNDDFNFDDLFSENLDVTENEAEEFSFENFEHDLADKKDRDSLLLTDNGAWSFILIKAFDDQRSVMLKKVNRILKGSQQGAVLLTWKQAAGSTALILFAIQSLFYLGLGFLGVGAVLVIMNALVFSVLERAGEIGTMRSLGASPGFIRSIFMIESLIITLGGAILGIILGIISIYLVQVSDMKLSNPLLISLFGGSELNPLITVKSIFVHLALAICIGSLAWIYPVSLAMKVQPITAMSKR
jgi:ABC-type lipoprotein release transport system permease subunit